MNDSERELLEETNRLVKKHDEFWFTPPTLDAEPRAVQLDLLFKHWKAGKSFFKISIYIGAGVISVWKWGGDVASAIAKSIDGTP